MPCLDAARGNKFVFDQEDYALIRFENSAAAARWSSAPTKTDCRSRLRHGFLRKVVLSSSASARPTSNYEAMLLRCLGDGPAFATASDGAWTLAPAPHGAEDAIYHRGRFYSVATNGVVESWERLDLGPGQPGMYRSTVVTSKLAKEDDFEMVKYLVESPAGQLMLLFRDHDRDGKTVFFKAEVLDEGRGVWEEVPDVGDAADLFVGINESFCLPTKEYPELRPGCVYFTDDDVHTWMAKQEPRDVGVYSLKDGRVEQIQTLGQHRTWPPPAWIMPRVA